MRKRKIDKLKFHLREGSLPGVAATYLKKPLHLFHKRFPGFSRDLLNKIKYGFSAPRYMERIWVDPLQINLYLDRDELKRVTGMNRTDASGYVLDWDRIEKTENVNDQYRIQYCYKRWNEGIPWEELGVFDYMFQTRKYKHYSREEMKERFETLDKTFQEIKKEEKLKTRKEIDPENFREKDGILVHIAKNGEPVFGGVGFHRLAMARILNLEKIPACVGLVDRNSIKYLRTYRNPES